MQIAIRFKEPCKDPGPIYVQMYGLSRVYPMFDDDLGYALVVERADGTGESYLLDAVASWEIRDGYDSSYHPPIPAVFGRDHTNDLTLASSATDITDSQGGGE